MAGAGPAGAAPGELDAAGLAFTFITTADPRYEAEVDLRYRVLRVPLGLGRDRVRFPFDDDSDHLVAATRAGDVVGCVLFHPAPDGLSGRLFQMAVDPLWQGRGLGRSLVARLEDALRARGVREITLHARDIAIGFYERLGYAAFGDPFVEVGIAHRHMRKLLADPPAPAED